MHACFGVGADESDGRNLITLELEHGDVREWRWKGPLSKVVRMSLSTGCALFQQWSRLPWDCTSTNPTKFHLPPTTHPIQRSQPGNKKYSSPAPLRLTTLLTTLALFLIIQPRLVSAQQCFTLSANSICGPQFAGYSVLARSGDTPGQDAYTDEASFDSWVGARIADDEAFATHWVNTLGCSSGPMLSAVAGLRYRVTWWCARDVQLSQARCRNPDNGPLICGEECGILSSRVRAIIDNQNVCPATSNSTFNTQRTFIKTVYTDWCATWGGPQLAANGVCANGTPNEGSFCGFTSQEEAIAQCPLNPDRDICCSQLFGGPAPPGFTPSSLLVTSTTTTTTSTVSESSSTLITSSTATSRNIPSTSRSATSTTSVLGSVPSGDGAAGNNGSNSNSSSSNSGSSITSLPILAPIIAASIALIIIVAALTFIAVKRRQSLRAAQAANNRPPMGMAGTPSTQFYKPTGMGSSVGLSSTTSSSSRSFGHAPGSATVSPHLSQPLPSAASVASVGYPATVTAAAAVAGGSFGGYQYATPPGSAALLQQNQQPPMGMQQATTYSPVSSYNQPQHQQQQQVGMTSTSGSVVSESGLLAGAASMGVASIPSPSSPSHAATNPSQFPPQQQQQQQQQHSNVTANPATPAQVVAAVAASPQGGALVMRVIHPYAPTLADELELSKGQEIVILRAFDDGWGLGLIPTSGMQGAFPLVCVSTGATSSSSGSEMSDGEAIVGNYAYGQDRLSALMSDAGVSKLGTSPGRRNSSRGK
ncbi:hypothetical protein HDU67_007942 [Dinochytrium kinnereticum]|nr:hypothetical protein HDU67_007942 [Dinochytrium kinnereticum]